MCQIWLQEDCDDADVFRQVDHDTAQCFALCLVFCEEPWLCLINILVRTADDRPYGSERLVEFHLLHGLPHRV